MLFGNPCFTTAGFGRGKYSPIQKDGTAHYVLEHGYIANLQQEFPPLAVAAYPFFAIRARNVKGGLFVKFKVDGQWQKHWVISGWMPKQRQTRFVDLRRYGEKVSGLWLNKPDGSVVRNPIHDLITNLDELPFRHFGGDCVYLIDQDRLTRGDPMLRHTEYRIYCSRGCPYKCAYCYNSSLRAIYPEGKGNYHRRRSVASVMEELRQARRLMPHMRWVKFDDDTFVFPRPWLEEFSAAYKAEFSDLPFDILITPDVVRYENLKMLKDAGLRGVQLGIEAGSDREQQEVYERTTTVQEILAFDRMNLELKLDTKYDVIIDNPLSITSDKDALFHLLLDLKAPYKIYLYSLTLFPKSKVTEKIIEAGLATRWDVEGWATKSFHQFRVDIDWPRSDEDTFYLALFMLASKRFVPHGLLRQVHASAYWRAHPRALLEIAQAVNLVRMSGIAAGMLWRGELSLQKVREYGNLRKMLNQ